MRNSRKSTVMIVNTQAPPKTAPADKKQYSKIVATNRRARFDYHIEDTFEAGVVLHGSEVKSLRMGRVDFSDSHAYVKDGEAWLMNLRISQYEKTTVQVPDLVRRRKLLMKKREIEKLEFKTDKSGYTLVPLEILFRGSWCKIRIGLAKGKGKEDKRQTIKSKEAKREMDRVMKKLVR